MEMEQGGSQSGNTVEQNDGRATSKSAGISIRIITFVDKEFTLHSGINKL